MGCDRATHSSRATAWSPLGSSGRWRRENKSSRADLGRQTLGSGRTHQRCVAFAYCCWRRQPRRCCARAFAARRAVKSEQAPPAVSTATVARPGGATLWFNGRRMRSGCALASTSQAPGGCGGVTRTTRTLVVVRAGSRWDGAGVFYQPPWIMPSPSRGTNLGSAGAAPGARARSVQPRIVVWFP